MKSIQIKMFKMEIFRMKRSKICLIVNVHHLPYYFHPFRTDRASEILCLHCLRHGSASSTVRPRDQYCKTLLYVDSS